MALFYYFCLIYYLKYFHKKKLALINNLVTPNYLYNVSGINVWFFPSLLVFKNTELFSSFCEDDQWDFSSTSWCVLIHYNSWFSGLFSLAEGSLFLSALVSFWHFPLLSESSLAFYYDKMIQVHSVVCNFFFVGNIFNDISVYCPFPTF